MTKRASRGLATVTAVALLAAGCIGTGTKKEQLQLDLQEPSDVGKGGRVVYVLLDVSCDMTSPQESHNRRMAIDVATHAAAFDGGMVVVGTVRALASQNIVFESVRFERTGSSAQLRKDNALDQRDKALKELRRLAAPGAGQPCRSDLLNAISELARQRRLTAQELGRDPPVNDLVFVTNGLIVDPQRKIVLTRDPIERSDMYAQTLKKIRQTWNPPDLHGFTIWFVGLGRDEAIKSGKRGPAIQRLWTDILKPTGADLREPSITADEVTSSLLRGSS